MPHVIVTLLEYFHFPQEPKGKQNKGHVLFKDRARARSLASPLFATLSEGRIKQNKMLHNLAEWPCHHEA